MTEDLGLILGLTDHDLMDLYRMTGREMLRTLRAAFVLDMAREATDPASVAFCQRRITLIDRVLGEREGRP